MPVEKPGRRRSSSTEEERPAEPAPTPSGRARQAKGAAAHPAADHRPGDDNPGDNGDDNPGNQAGATHPDLSHAALPRLRARLVRKYH